MAGSNKGVDVNRGRRLSNALLAGQSSGQTSRSHLVPLRNKSIFMTAFADDFETEDAANNNADTASHGGNTTNLLPSAKQRLLYENSYRILPEPSTQFYVSHAKQVVEAVIAHQLQTQQLNRYDPDKARRLCLHLANSARRAVKQSLNIPRYKIVAYVVVGQNCGQDFSCASRCLWFPQTDNYVQSEIKVGDLFAICTIFGVYYE